MDAGVKIRPLGASKWLETHSKWSTDGAAVSGQTLIAYGVTQFLSQPLREDDRAREEICCAQVVRIVRSGNECRRPDVELRNRHPSLVSVLFRKSEWDGFDDSGRGWDTDPLWIAVQL